MAGSRGVDGMATASAEGEAPAGASAAEGRRRAYGRRYGEALRRSAAFREVGCDRWGSAAGADGADRNAACTADSLP